MEFELNYIKDNIPESLSDFLNVSNMQNYNPLYNLFFKLNENNYNQIQLNEKLKLKSIRERISHNQFECVLQDSNNKINKQMFIKFSPIIDPTKYMIGKYDLSDDDLFEVPSLFATKDGNVTDKKNNPFNSAYIDGFFSFLSSKLLHVHNVENANDYYGSFTGNQNDFRYNVYDDVDYLCESDFFHTNKNVLFELDESFEAEYDNSGSRDNKKKIKIDTNKLSLKSVDHFNDNIYDNIFTSSTVNTISNSNDNTANDIAVNDDDIDFSLEKIELSHPIINLKNNRSTTNSTHSSTCSSRTSITDNNEDISIDDLESLDDMSSCSSECSNENIYAHIQNFPVNIIALEMCDNTLDDYMMNEDISDKEWAALLLQVILTLLIYQKTFQFTHNDLHSNNIMYVKTEKQFLFYNFNNKYYKIPTFGKIWKIIDFGRAIYKYKDTIICSDCFDKNEDADGQYNCEPFLNESKPRLEPNNSFDLCRLGCSLFDFFIDDVTDVKQNKLSSIEKIIVDWCYDDNNKNILYKKNGEERYPEFKLYKMIARTVHKHTPENQLDHDVFSAFQVSKKKLNHSQQKKILYINDLPNYT